MLHRAEREAMYQIALVQARRQRTPAERRRRQYADWTGLDRRSVVVVVMPQRTEPRALVDAKGVAR